MASKTVGIFGGGMAGLSAAHELIRRGYDVHVFESLEEPGGKSKNQAVANPVDGQPIGTGGPPPTASLGASKPVPGEHGFRFFPGFYRHVIATMKEIPNADDPSRSVADDLVPSPEAGIARSGLGVLSFPRRADQVPLDILGKLTTMYGGLEFQPEDLARMAWFRLKYLTSGQSRRRDAYEKISWWQFIDGDSPRYSNEFRRFEESIPRTMSAMEPRKSSARVIGDITMQMILGYGRPSEEPDRLLVGPSSERWVTPWVADLSSRGVNFHFEQRLVGIDLVPGTKKIEKMIVAGPGGTVEEKKFDYYVLALPVEQVIPLLTDPVKTADAALKKISLLPETVWTNWMVGAQYFLKTDHPMAAGHVFYPDSPWALTSISQAQFWNQSGQKLQSQYGNGKIRGILSVIVSEWDTEGFAGKTAKQMSSPEEVLEETLLQLQQAAGEDWLAWEKDGGDVVSAHLDDSIKFGPGVGAKDNEFPLLVHRVGSWESRPEAKNEIENLYLAADYVRTHTQLATMEGANEAARRAVNALLDDDPDNLYTRCDVWELQEEPIFDPAKRLDDRRHAEGRAHIMDEEPLSTWGLDGAEVTLDVLAALLEAGGGCLSAL